MKTCSFIRISTVVDQFVSVPITRHLLTNVINVTNFVFVSPKDVTS